MYSGVILLHFVKSEGYIIIALATIVVGCGREEVFPVEEQEVAVYVKGVESGDFTKASGSAVSTLIESLFPASGVTFTLSSTSNPERVYTVDIGKSITIPIDTYSVTAYYRPTSVGNTVKNGYIYKTPRFYVDTVISINKGQKNYTVDATYECWALVIDYTTCSKYEHLGYNYTMEDFTYFYGSGDLGIAFIYGSWTTQPYTIKSCPKENSGYEARSYNLVTDKNYTGIFIEYGKWYAFSTSSVDDTSGSIGVNYPGWSEGSTSE